MSSVELSSVEWFITFMRLHSRGVTPTVTPTAYMPSQSMLSDYWGESSGHGYSFRDQGIPEYGVYVRDLFSRVLQLPWPVSGSMPKHFAGGLMVEALGVEVNWADLAFRVTHPHQSFTGIPRILEQYKSLEAPLPALPIVMPLLHPSRASPLAASIVKYLNESGGITAGVDRSTTCEAGGAGDIADATEPMKTDVDLQAPAVADGAGTGHVQGNTGASGIFTLCAPAVAALVVLLPHVLGALNFERTRLHAARSELTKPGSELRHCLSEQRGSLRLVEQKVAEKTRDHERAVAQFLRARQVLNAARVEAGAPTAHEQKSALKTSVKICEQLVGYCAENVAAAHTQLESWELEMKTQREQVSKSHAELTAAEQLYREESRILDASLSQLQALDLALASVGGFTMGV